MGITAVDGEGLEVWRGGVNPWQCDQMGHLNVRFYVAQAMEGLAGVAAALGMVGAFSPAGTSTLVVREHHIRFLKEARAGDALYMTCGLIELGEADACLLQILRHALTGEPAAVFQTRLVHAKATDAEPFPWSTAARDFAAALMVEIPAGLEARSLTPGEAGKAGSVTEADRMGLQRYGAGTFGGQECDVFGRVGAHHVMARISDGAAQAIADTRLAMAQATPGAPTIGVAVVEYRLAYLERPRAGDRYDMRSGLRFAQPRRLSWSHWLLDPSSGRPTAVADGVLVPFDLKARKTITLPDAALEALQAQVVKGL